MDFPRTTARRRVRLNMTALTDVVFLLLIFFMITANFVHTEAMDVVLPGKGSAAVKELPPLVLRLDRNAQLFVNGAPTDKTGVEEAVKHALMERGNAPIQIQSDPDVLVEHLVGVLDLVYQTGGRNIAIVKSVTGGGV